MPPTNPYFLNPNAGFTPSRGLSARPDVDTGQAGQGTRMPVLPIMQGPFTTGQQGATAPGRAPAPGSGAPQTGIGGYSTAVRPTDQSDNPQAAWLQNMATFAGGNLAGSTALGNQGGPVRRLVDVLGQQPFGEQNPMTLLMQALQQGNYGVQMPNQNSNPTPSQIYRPPTYSNPIWGAPGRPYGFNPMQMVPQ